MELLIKFCKVIQDTASIFEESYSEKDYNKDKQEYIEKHKEKLGEEPILIPIDPKNYYKKDLYQSAEEACKKNGLDEKMVYPIYLLLRFNWNESLDWATSTIANFIQCEVK